MSLWVILNKHTQLEFKFTDNFLSNTINSFTLRYQQAAYHRRILQYYMFNLCLSQFYISFLLIRVSPDRSAVEYLSGRKVTKVCPAVVTT